MSLCTVYGPKECRALGSLVRHLDEFGFVVVDELVDRDTATNLEGVLERAMLAEAEPESPELRIRGLLNNPTLDDVSSVEGLLLHPVLLELATLVLGGDYRIAEIGVRWLRPGAEGLPLHVGFPADWFASMSRPIPSLCCVLTFSWVLSDITPDNGARSFVPASHRIGARPDTDGHDSYVVQVTAKAGSMIAFNSAVWHGILPNTSSSSSRVELASAYCVPWIDREMAGWILSDPSSLLHRSERMRMLHSGAS